MSENNSGEKVGLGDSLTICPCDNPNDIANSQFSLLDKSLNNKVDAIIQTDMQIPANPSPSKPSGKSQLSKILRQRTEYYITRDSNFVGRK